MSAVDILRMEEFYQSLPIIIKTENISYSCGVKKMNEIVWEDIYQAFKHRLEHERGGK